VELVLVIPPSGQVADVQARCTADLMDATGQSVRTRCLDTTAAVKALLTAAQKAALADLMTTLHAKAVTKLL
jgi:hypothetical protein